MTVSDKLKSIEPYVPNENICKIRLDANESFIEIPQDIKNEIAEACKGILLNRYPDVLSSGVCKKFAKVHNISENLVTAGNGSDELIGVIISSFLKKGDKLLTLTSDFSMYSFYAKITENPVDVFQKEDDLSIDVSKLIKALNNKDIKMLIFSNPCNPTSLGLFREDVISIIKSTKALVVLDEAYMDFWDQSLLSRVEEFDNLIILRTCSKAFGSAAIRLGFAVANKTLTAYLRAAKSPYNVNSLTQAAGEVILGHIDFLKTSAQKIICSTKYLHSELCKLPDIIYMPKPDTNFVLIKLKNAKEVYQSLIKCDIMVRQMGNFLRITAGNKYENDALIKALKSIL